jgi:hypothetical protein
MRRLFLLVAAFVPLVLALPAEAGRVDGPMRPVRTVQGFHVWTFKVRFTPNQPATVTVQGDGDSPLSLVVLDAEGRRVAGDMRSGDRFQLRWVPTSAEPYQIKVHNRGGVPNRFRLTTN